MKVKELIDSKHGSLNDPPHLEYYECIVKGSFGLLLVLARSTIVVHLLYSTPKVQVYITCTIVIVYFIVHVL